MFIKLGNRVDVTNKSELNIKLNTRMDNATLRQGRTYQSKNRFGERFNFKLTVFEEHEEYIGEYF